MRKTAAGRLVIGLVNVALIVVLATAIISFIPPQYGFSPGAMSADNLGSIERFSMSYTVTNNGFYAIDNFYVGITIEGPTGELVSQSHTTPVEIQRGASITNIASVDVNMTYISSHPGTYTITLDIHSEFAFGLLKTTVSVPVSYTFP